MKIKWLFFIVFAQCIYSNAQIKLSADEASELKISVHKKAESTNSIISEFVQLKHLDFLSNDIKSSGMLYYKEPNSIKWEYLNPFKYAAIFKRDQLLINDDGKKSDIDLSANKAFKSLNNLVVRSVKGDLFDESEFEITYYKTDADYEVHFIPIDDKLKSFISEFEIVFDGNTFDVISVKMLESSDDYTLLQFANQQFNQPIADAIFTN